ncbi:CaiB/BaiF CoA transferase family protein [Verminephrobacter eiseniae]|uniref:Formyl-CoA transferase n=1 Tax=Verminephrobacter eiseniae (strain EF01-2) TaxID=391735 RepID=A1WI83_VEREI|nr:CoA transferase [Verminephrobacter eiseniae]ABM57340.1 Formyl-CoA transferase [Verminephrobacter eiseniae EF01-2]MCW5282968.1 CoA transferase [Verminephrobacter eiseniae]MCW5303283.1 CoA transferase [Verminephrobacter eiseniae]MCW8178130.1 CoA transferase [Verminephrobacter eiseniae]MCW8188676.1 CoA transferase [Verminephrobacter eiseniae]
MTPAAVVPGALDGLVVLDLTRMLAGPYATMMLADQGAHVIKIEPPGGDLTRRNGPHPDGALKIGERGFGGYFASINRNKDSITLDLKKPAGKATLLRLVHKADVLVENYRAGVMERLGLGYEVLIAENPRLVYAALRGFGDPRSGASPYANWPAYDPVAQAMGGIMGITGAAPGGPPTKIGPGVGDLVPATFLAYGVAAACWRAQRSGQGQFVDVSMVDAVLALCERLVFQYSVSGVAPGPEGNGHPLLCPFGLFAAKDGFVSLGVPNDRFWVPLAHRMGRPALAIDPRYASNDARVQHRAEVEAIVGGWTARHTKAELAQMLGGDIPFGPVFSAADIFEDPHFRIREMLVETEQPGAARPLTVAGTPVRMSQTPGGVRRRAPLTGEHTDSTLAAFGFAPAEIAALRADQVIQ